MLDLTKNKHVKTINSMKLPVFGLGVIVNTPIGLGIIVKTPNLEWDGLWIKDTYGKNYTVYFGMPNDKVNQHFIDTSEDQDLVHEANKWMSKVFTEEELINPNRYTPQVFTTEKALKEQKEAEEWDNWRDSLVKKNN